MHKQIKSIIPYIIIIILLNKISTTDDIASCWTKSESRIIDAQRFKLSGTNQLILTTPATNQAKLITMSFLHKDRDLITDTIFWHSTYTLIYTSKSFFSAYFQFNGFSSYCTPSLSSDLYSTINFTRDTVSWFFFHFGV